jgi:hypothetical protein
MRIGKPRHRDKECHHPNGAKGIAAELVDDGAFTHAVLAHAGNRARGTPVLLCIVVASACRAGEVEGRKEHEGKEVGKGRHRGAGCRRCVAAWSLAGAARQSPKLNGLERERRREGGEMD